MASYDPFSIRTELHSESGPHRFAPVTRNGHLANPKTDMLDYDAYSIPDDSSSTARTTFAPSIRTATELSLSFRRSDKQSTLPEYVIGTHQRQRGTPPGVPAQDMHRQ
jgi:hypothetical protein